MPECAEFTKLFAHAAAHALGRVYDGFLVLPGDGRAADLHALLAALAGLRLDAVGRVLAVMGMIAFGFLLFILFTSNPFSRSLPPQRRQMRSTASRCT